MPYVTFAQVARLCKEMLVLNFLQVLDADRNLLEAEFKPSELQRKYLDSVVQLYKALGGGWSTSIDERAEASAGK